VSRERVERQESAANANTEVNQELRVSPSALVPLSSKGIDNLGREIKSEAIGEVSKVVKEDVKEDGCHHSTDGNGRENDHSYLRTEILSAQPVVYLSLHPEDVLQHCSPGGGQFGWESLLQSLRHMLHSTQQFIGRRRLAAIQKAGET
jgi:hypothetical protein